MTTSKQRRLARAMRRIEKDLELQCAQIFCQVIREVTKQKWPECRPRARRDDGD